MLVKMHTICLVSYKLKKSIAFIFFMQDVSLFHQKYCHRSVVITYKDIKNISQMQIYFQMFEQKKKHKKKLGI